LGGSLLGSSSALPGYFWKLVAVAVRVPGIHFLFEEKLDLFQYLDPIVSFPPERNVGRDTGGRPVTTSLSGHVVWSY